MNQKLVSDIGEQGLLKVIKSFCPQEIIGDDGAVLSLTPGYQLVVTTDVLVDGVHFSDRTTSAFDVGWRSAAANLSDLAAMGANPLGITVGLSLPKNTPVAWVEQLYHGISRCLDQFATFIVGGDLTCSKVITVAITAMGEVLPHRIITRSQAQPGDAILITGYHGLSRAGLELLLNPSKAKYLNPSESEFLIKKHQQPQPRLDVVQKLREIAANAVIAGMDSSDGLENAISQICQNSQLGAVIDLESIPRCPLLSKLPSDCPLDQWLLNGGEDFELVLSLETNLAQQLLTHLGEGAAIIGQMNQSSQLVISDRLKSQIRNISDLTAEFQHF